MPSCELCDGETFESRNGLYYCLTCGTQSQDLRDEVVEEQFDADERLAVRANKGRKGRKPYERTEGRPWLVQEAYQIIIQKQVEFLIRNGVDSRLKDVVGQLWFKYLSITGIAFCSSQKALLISNENSEVGQYKHNARALGKEKAKKKKKTVKEEEDVMLELCSEIANEEFYQEDDPRQRKMEDDSTDNDEDGMSSSSSDDDDTYVATGSSAASLDYRSSRTHMRITVALVYLGLLMLDESIFLSDLIRWIREGHFPYLEAASLLPSHMKFTDQDSSIITPNALPTKELLFLDCAYLVKQFRLSLPEQNMRKYTARYILNLNLPVLTHGFVNNLLKVFKPDAAFWKLHHRVHKSQSLHFEETAMAYIFIALKMCYGLDDSQDQVESNLAENTTSSESPDSLPVWRDWVSASRQCQNKTMTSGVPWTQEHLHSLQDPQTYTTFCKTHIFGAWAKRDREMTSDVKKSVIGAKMKYSRKEYRESCAEIFASLTGDTTTSTPPPTIFPYSCRHGNDTANQNQEDCFKETKSCRVSLESFKQLCGNQAKDNEGEDGPPKRKYIKYFRVDSTRQATHPSFRFLVDLMAKHIETKPELLEATIIKMECLLLDGRELPVLQKKSVRTKNKYKLSSSAGN